MTNLNIFETRKENEAFTVVGKQIKYDSITEEVPRVFNPMVSVIEEINNAIDAYRKTCPKKRKIVKVEYEEAINTLRITDYASGFGTTEEQVQNALSLTDSEKKNDPRFIGNASKGSFVGPLALINPPKTNTIFEHILSRTDGVEFNINKKFAFDNLVDLSEAVVIPSRTELQNQLTREFAPVYLSDSKKKEIISYLSYHFQRELINDKLDLTVFGHTITPQDHTHKEEVIDNNPNDYREITPRNISYYSFKNEKNVSYNATAYITDVNAIRKVNGGGNDPRSQKVVSGFGTDFEKSNGLNSAENDGVTIFANNMLIARCGKSSWKHIRKSGYRSTLNGKRIVIDITGPDALLIKNDICGKIKDGRDCLQYLIDINGNDANGKLYHPFEEFCNEIMKNIPNPEDTTHGENSSRKRETTLAYYDDIVNTLKRLTQLSRSNLSDLEPLQADAAKLLEQLSNPKRHRGKLDSKMTKLMSTNHILSKNKTIVDYLLDGRDIDIVAKITHKAKHEVEKVHQELVTLGLTSDI